MYRIFYGEKVLHDPFTQDEIVYDVSCYGGVNDKGSMTFTVNPFHPLYNELEIRNKEVILKSDEDILFIGYIYSISKNFNTSKEVTVYGILGYLSDVYLRPYELKGTGAVAFNYYIEEYNKKAKQRLEIGINEAGYNLENPENAWYANTSYASVASEIEDKLLEVYGGYLYVSYQDDRRLINYASDVSNVNDQIIDFGVNLLNYVKEDTSDNFYNALVALGGVPEKEEGSKEQPEQIKLTDYKYSKYNNFAIEDDVMINQASVNNYGYRENVITYQDVTDPNDLVKLAYKDLNQASKIQTSIVISAIDLALYQEKYTHLKVNDIVRIRSLPHDVDEYMVVTEMDLDLDDPANTEYTLGIVYDTLTGETSSKLTSLNSSLNRTVDAVDGISEEAKAAAQEAKDAKTKAEEVNGRLDGTIKDLEDFQDSIKNQLKDMKNLIDGAIMTWFYPGAPSLFGPPTNEWVDEDTMIEHLGDLYYDTVTGYCYRWMVTTDSRGDQIFSWSQISDIDVIEALRLASQAKDTADSKRRVFYETPWPPYDEGDLWCQGSEGDILVCKNPKTEKEKYNPDDWLQASKYDNAVYSSEEEFYNSDSPDELVGGSWSKQNVWVDGKYVWRRTLITYGNGTKEYVPSSRGICISGNTGKQGLPGVDGKDGIPGAPGADGRTSYFHIKYSDFPNPTTPDQMTETPSEYIGTCVDYVKEDPKDPSSYKWSKFQGKDGADGIPGKNGINGETTYLHIAYANSPDGMIGFSVDDSEGKLYIGQYTDFIKADSTNPAMYKWTLIKGEDGEDGKDGKNGKDGEQGPPGPEGPPGENGIDGIGISSTIIDYQIGDSGQYPPTGLWLSSIPKPVKGKYLWTRTTIHYTNNTETSTYSVSYFPNDGTDGKDADQKTFTGSSDSEASSSTKIAHVESGFKLEAGVVVSIKFKYSNVAANPTLNVNDTGNYFIMLNGVFYAYWMANQTVLFVFDGNHWNIASTNTYANTSTVGNPAEHNVYLDSKAVEIRRGTTVNASFKENLIELGKNSEFSTIEFCGGTGKVGFIDEYRAGESGTESDRVVMPPTFLIKSLRNHVVDGVTTRDPVNIIASDWDNYSWASAAGSNALRNKEGRLTVGAVSSELAGSYVNILTPTLYTIPRIFMNGLSWLDYVYPVGSIYMTVRSISPADLFGGTWTKIQNDTYLISQSVTSRGDLTNASNSTTGHTHSLGSAYGKYEQSTLDNGREHYRYKTTSAWTTNYRLSNAGNAGTLTYNATSGMELGGSTDSTNYWPPYQTVYMWRRTG